MVVTTTEVYLRADIIKDFERCIKLIELAIEDLASKSCRLSREEQYDILIRLSLALERCRRLGEFL